MRPTPFAALLFLGGSVLGELGCSQDIQWSAVEVLIESSFPEVEQISTDSLARALDALAASDLILLDTRTKAEYEVSHIRGAIHVSPETTDFALLDSLDHGAQIVTYCSVGYRSAEIADRLRKAGFDNVANLKGSIFRWANEGRPVVRGGDVVREVHPYDRVWGKLLNPELRTYAQRQPTD